jgi:carbon storage regulator
MLVLTRKVGEEIVIAGTIRVTVVAVKRKRVRLGVAAPMAVSVDRDEVHERRQHEFANQAAESGVPGRVRNSTRSTTTDMRVHETT